MYEYTRDAVFKSWLTLHQNCRDTASYNLYWPRDEYTCVSELCDHWLVNYFPDQIIALKLQSRKCSWKISSMKWRRAFTELTILTNRKESYWCVILITYSWLIMPASLSPNMCQFYVRRLWITVPTKVIWMPLISLVWSAQSINHRVDARVKRQA